MRRTDRTPPRRRRCHAGLAGLALRASAPARSSGRCSALAAGACAEVRSPLSGVVPAQSLCGHRCGGERHTGQAALQRALHGCALCVLLLLIIITAACNTFGTPCLRIASPAVLGFASGSALSQAPAIYVCWKSVFTCQAARPRPRGMRAASASRATPKPCTAASKRSKLAGSRATHRSRTPPAAGPLFCQVVWAFDKSRTASAATLSASPNGFSK